MRLDALPETERKLRPQGINRKGPRAEPDVTPRTNHPGGKKTLTELYHQNELLPSGSHITYLYLNVKVCYLIDMSL